MELRSLAETLPAVRFATKAGYKIMIDEKAQPRCYFRRQLVAIRAHGRDHLGKTSFGLGPLRGLGLVRPDEVRDG